MVELDDYFEKENEKSRIINEKMQKMGMEMKGIEVQMNQMNMESGIGLKVGECMARQKVMEDRMVMMERVNEMKEYEIQIGRRDYERMVE